MPGLIVVKEHQDSEPISLTVAERDALLRLSADISITPVVESDGIYRLNPGNTVGAIQLNEMRFELRPKLEVRRLMFLLGYAMNPDHWRTQGFDFEEDQDLFEAIVPGFAFQVEEALRRGVQHAYRAEEAALQTVRGRIRFNDHLRSRFGLIPPIECQFDEFTDDIEVNRLLKAAIARLGAIRLRSEGSRHRLRTLWPHFANVSLVAYEPRNVPEVRYDRRTVHLRGAVELARRILSTRSIDSRSGDVTGAAFLLNLASVFEDFVVISLRESLGASEHSFPQQARGKSLYLDEGAKLRLKPDLSWWNAEQCRFVGDVKYKKTRGIAGAAHPDVYQLLAYATATARRRGLLVYAVGEEPSGIHQIRGAGKEIAVRALDLDVSPEEVLAQIDELAEIVRSQASDPPHVYPASMVVDRPAGTPPPR